MQNKKEVQKVQETYKIKEAYISEEPLIATCGFRYYKELSLYNLWNNFDFNIKKLLKHLRFAITDENQMIFIAIDDEDVVGLYWVALDVPVWSSSKIAVDRFLYVIPEYRGFNIGAKFIKEFEKWAKSKRAKAIFTAANSGLYDNVPADHLYEHARFNCIGNTYLKFLK